MGTQWWRSAVGLLQMRFVPDLDPCASQSRFMPGLYHALHVVELHHQNNVAMEEAPRGSWGSCSGGGSARWRSVMEGVGFRWGLVVEAESL